VSDCVFCKIATGEIPAATVYEDDYVVAFDDLSPQTPVHTLIVPRTHYQNLGDNVDDATLNALFRAVPAVARAKGVESTGYRVIINNGPDANQTVAHLHIHVLGGRAMAHGMVRFDED